MKPDKKKDALTDVVDISTAPQSGDSGAKVGEGQAIASSGEVVTLGVDKEVDSIARKLVSLFKRKR